MNWTEFIKEIANQKIPNDKYHKTFIEIFGECETIKKLSEKLEVEEKTIGGHLTEIYKYFEPQCHDLKIKDGKGKKDILRKHLQTLYASQKDAGEISHPTPPINYPNISTAIVGLSNKQDNCNKEYDPNFVGRESAFTHINNLINKGAKIILIQSPGGGGKTTLANKYLRNKFKIVIEFPIAKETKDIASVESLLEEKLRQLGEEPGREFIVSLDRLKQKLQTEEIGILIDNLEPALDASGKFIEQHRSYVELLRILTDSSLKSLTLITSREKLYEASIEIETYGLPGLTLAAWQEYFNHQKIINSESLQEIRDAFGGNAKAMNVISKAIIQDYDRDLEKYWLKNKEDLLIESTLENLIKEQFKRLQEINIHDAYNLLCRMGCYRYQDVPTVPEKGLFCLLWDVAENKHQRIIRVLKERGLVEFYHDDYWLHPVIRKEAIERLRNSEDWEKVNVQAGEFWTESIKEVNTVKDALTAFESYYHYLSIEDYEKIVNILFIYRRNDKNKWHRFKGGISLFSDFRRLGLLRNIERIREIKDNINAYNIPDLSIAYYRGIGCILLWSGNINSAIKIYNERINLINKKCKKPFNDLWNINDSHNYFTSLASIGYSYLNLFNLDDAEKYWNKVLEISNKDNKNNYKFNFYIESSVVLAFIESSKDGSDIDLINKLLEIVFDSSVIEYQNISFHCSAYRLLFGGLAYKNIGKIEQAQEKFDKIFNEENENKIYLYKPFVGLAHSLQAEVYIIKNDITTALAHHQQSIEILEKIGAKCDLAEAYFQQALTYQKMKNKANSDEYFHKAMYLWSPQQIDAPKQIERVLNAMNSEP